MLSTSACGLFCMHLQLLACLLLTACALYMSYHPGLLLGTKDPFVTPNGIDFTCIFLSTQVIDHDMKAFRVMHDICRQTSLLMTGWACETILSIPQHSRSRPWRCTDCRHEFSMHMCQQQSYESHSASKCSGLTLFRFWSQTSKSKYMIDLTGLARLLDAVNLRASLGCFWVYTGSHFVWPDKTERFLLVQVDALTMFWIGVPTQLQQLTWCLFTLLQLTCNCTCVTLCLAAGGCGQNCRRTCIRR